MPKVQKTRKQKILADTRRETDTTSLYSFTPQTLTAQSKPVISKKSSTAIMTSAYPYLASDLRKTLLFTGFVVLAELVLYFFL